jgi:hypothetical protein
MYVLHVVRSSDAYCTHSKLCGLDTKVIRNILVATATVCNHCNVVQQASYIRDGRVRVNKYKLQCRSEYRY